MGDARLCERRYRCFPGCGFFYAQCMPPCPVCGAHVAWTGQRGPAPRYCSRRCKQAAQMAARRRRRAQEAAQPWGPERLVALLVPARLGPPTS